MRIAYLDCFSGIAGDMCLGALVDAGADLDAIQCGIASLELDARLRFETVQRQGFRGLSVRIDHAEQHVHRSFWEIRTLIEGSAIEGNAISESARNLAIRIFERLAKAEGQVHGMPPERVTFHEVGAIDSIIDIVGTAIAWTSLRIEQAYASPVPTGTGSIQIAHGRVAIPAPATAELLRNVPIAPCSISKEMTTPTGAAILCELVSQFGSLPSMQVARIGYGAGTRDLEDRPNLLRVLIGESVARVMPSNPSSNPQSESTVIILETNLDDVTGEQVGFAVERLWDAGALDVFLVPIQMKKGRPGTLLSVIATPESRATMESILFQHTGTLGVRYRTQSRSILSRTQVNVETPWGIVPGKVSQLPDGSVCFSAEFDACRDIAIEEGIRLADVMEEVKACYETRWEDEEDDLAQEDFSEPIDAPKIFQDPHDDTGERGGGGEEGDIDPKDASNWYRWDSSPWKDE
jgi:pyridinium-3,5-bisthiocarboxylic acid mononucleotide nickel chelatase